MTRSGRDGASGDEPVDFAQRWLFGPPSGPEAVQSRHVGAGVPLQRLVAAVLEEVGDAAVVNRSGLYAREHDPGVLVGLMHRVQPYRARQVLDGASLALCHPRFSHAV